MWINVRSDTVCVQIVYCASSLNSFSANSAKSLSTACNVPRYRSAFNSIYSISFIVIEYIAYFFTFTASVLLRLIHVGHKW